MKIRRTTLSETFIHINSDRVQPVVLSFQSAHSTILLQNFEPGKPTNLTVTCQENIGTITHVHLWTKARDERDSLYVDYITVAEPELKKT